MYGCFFLASQLTIVSLDYIRCDDTIVNTITTTTTTTTTATTTTTDDNAATSIVISGEMLCM